MARTYGERASKKVERAMHKRKEGSLRSGRSGKKVTSRKQAIAIGLSEARKEGGKVPGKRGSSGGRSSGRKKGSSGATSNSRGSKKTSSRKGSSASQASKSSGGGRGKKKEGLIARIIHTIV